MRVGPCIPVGLQRQKAEVGPTSGPTWHLSHLMDVVQGEEDHQRRGDRLLLGGGLEKSRLLLAPSIDERLKKGCLQRGLK